ncbi:MAG: hypothetical protein Fur0044_17950 [Anaerolineae bacterium]
MMIGDWKTLATFPAQFEAFFNDHFGFRNRLVEAYSLLSVALESSPNSQIVVGTEGWYYYAGSGEVNNVENYRNTNPLTPQELWQWKWSLETKYHWLKKKGINYVMVIVPEKHTIYGEYYPSRIQQVGRQSHLDQLIEYMKDSEVPILDLRQPLLQAKPVGLLYYKTDSHWNSLGAAVAQYEIMQYVAKKYPIIHPIQYQAEDFSWFKKSNFDLVAMVNLHNIIEESPALIKKRFPKCDRFALEKQAYFPQVEDETREPFSTDCHQPGTPYVLIFRDSFFNQLQPYISQYFSNATYVWTRPDFNTLEQFVKDQPTDIVIEEWLERFIKMIPKLPTPEDEAYQVLLERCFQAGETVYQMTEDRQKGVAALQQIKIIPAEQGYKLISQGEDPYFVLPKFEASAAWRYVIKIGLQGPQPTTWQIFYKTPQEPAFNEENSMSGQLHSGDNTFFVILDGEDAPMQVRIDPGTVSGEYLLKSLEVRAVRK